MLPAILKLAARRRGEDVIDFSMGNPDGPTPRHIVDKLVETIQRPDTHGYSVSKGIHRLRKAICNWYQTRYKVELDPDSEAIVTIGSKEGIAHLALATLERGDVVLVPNPSYPIHIYGPVIAGADIRHVPMQADVDFFEELEKAIRDGYPKPKMLIVNFPSNPTTQCVDLAFFERLIAIAREHDIYVVHDLAYADIVFRRLQGAVDSGSAGRQGNRGRILHHVQKLQHGRVARGLHGRQPRPRVRAGSHEELSRLRHLHADSGGLHHCHWKARRNASKKCGRPTRTAATCCAPACIRRGWMVDIPKATMYVWAPIPEQYKKMGSLEFSKKLLSDAKIAVAPGTGFGHYGDGHVRFAMIENEARTRQAVRGIKEMFRKDGLL